MFLALMSHFDVSRFDVSRFDVSRFSLGRIWIPDVLVNVCRRKVDTTSSLDYQVLVLSRSDTASFLNPSSPPPHHTSCMVNHTYRYIEE
jgi:hypothetical protein